MHEDDRDDQVGADAAGEPDGQDPPAAEPGDAGRDEADDGWPEWEPSEGGAGPAVLVGVFVLGVVTCLAVVLSWGAVTADDGETAPTAGVGLAAGTESHDAGHGEQGQLDAGAAPGAGAPVGTRLSRCVRAARSLEGPLAAARPALDQWAVHVGAMNQLVVGEITLQQATAFWERTRLGAQRRVDGFREAMATLRRSGVDCPRADLLAPGARALPACAEQVEAEAEALRAAGTSIHTWDEHVHHMDMLRMGDLSPEEATRMWLSMWQRGARDLDVYRAAAREARGLNGCATVGTAG